MLSQFLNNYLSMKYPIDPFYESEKWQEIRSQALRRDGYQDQHEKRYGRYRQAEVVHHIFPRDRFPEYELELWNLISLSRKSHNFMHDRNTDELTDVGIELLQRTAKKQGIPIPPEYRTKKKEKSGRRPNWRNYYD